MRIFVAYVREADRPYLFLMRPDRIRDGKLTAFGAKSAGSDPEMLPVSDLVYLAAGAGMFVVMALYALACDRL